MRILHLVKVRFDRRRMDITQEWLDNRYEFFAKYTLPSLLQQIRPGNAGAYKDWVLWINCDAGMREMVDKLSKLLLNIPISQVWSFGDSIPQGMVDTSGIYFKHIDYVYVTRIDSDDCYTHDALSLAACVQPRDMGEVEASIFRRGYMYELPLLSRERMSETREATIGTERRGRVGVYFNPSSPFHTIMYPKEVFIDKEKYDRVWHKIGDHSRVESALYSHPLPHFKFCVLIHGNNFLSTFDYGRERDFPYIHQERGWDLQRFLQQSVVFDIDDFCDTMGGVSGNEVLEQLDTLKARYPEFRCTLFTIPQRTTKQLLERAKKRSWIEIAVHGITHSPNLEMKSVTHQSLNGFLAAKVDYDYYCRGFKAPGWYITPQHIESCNANGLWVALDYKDAPSLGPLCKYGYYTCGERMPYWHGHTHNVCGNWVKQHLPALLEAWHPLQKFSFVSESVLVSSII